MTTKDDAKQALTEIRSKAVVGRARAMERVDAWDRVLGEIDTTIADTAWLSPAGFSERLSKISALLDETMKARAV